MVQTQRTPLRFVVTCRLAPTWLSRTGTQELMFTSSASDRSTRRQVCSAVLRGKLKFPSAYKVLLPVAMGEWSIIKVLLPSERWDLRALLHQNASLYSSLLFREMIDFQWRGCTVFWDHGEIMVSSGQDDIGRDLIKGLLTQPVPGWSGDVRKGLFEVVSTLRFPIGFFSAAFFWERFFVQNQVSRKQNVLGCHRLDNKSQGAQTTWGWREWSSGASKSTDVLRQEMSRVGSFKRAKTPTTWVRIGMNSLVFQSAN